MKACKQGVRHTQIERNTVTDPGFPIGGGTKPLGGSRPPMRVLFGKNVYENEKIGSCWGGARRRRPLDPPMKYK